MNQEKKRVVIIGAGPAGLTAAFELLQQAGSDYEVTILEATDSIGGISKTVTYDGNRMDLGGHRFFSKDQRVMDWWNARMPVQGAPSKDDLLTGTEKPLTAGGPDPQTCDRVMLYRNRVSRIYYLRHFFDYPISLKPALFINMGFSNTIQAGFSYLASVFHRLPETSLENFYRNRFGKKLYSMFFENYTEKVWGRHPSVISADWGSQRVKGLSVSKILNDMFSKLLPKSMRKGKEIETSLIEQFWYPKFGPGQLWELVADDVVKMGGKLLMNSPVCGLRRTESGRIDTVCCNVEGHELQYPADLVISSMPLRDLTADLSGEIPEDVRRVAAGLPYRDFVTVGLQVRKLNLRNTTKIKTPYDRIPDDWIYIQEPEVRMGRLQVFNNWSPYLVRDFEHSMSIGLEYFCNEGDEIWTKPDADFVHMAVDELAAMDIINPADVTNSHVEHVKKAYPAYFDSYSEIDTLITWLNTIDNLFCIGRNGQHRYNNMDHSMVTAFETVKAILSHSKDKSAIWNVNTEKNYHEETDSI